MEIVVIAIMFLAWMSLMLKLTCLPFFERLAIGLLCALFVGLSWETAANQSKANIDLWLQNPQLMLDMAVLLTVDVFIQIAFCIQDARLISGRPMSKPSKAIYAATLWFPGLLIFPTLFAIVVEAIFSTPGMDFAVLAWSIAAAVFIAALLVPTALKWLTPERDIRLELIFMINVLIALLGIVATVNGRTAVAGTNSVEWNALAGVLGLIALGASTGLILFKRKNKKPAKKPIIK